MTTMAISAAKLPLYTLDLMRRYWAPLLCVYAAGTFLHDMLIRGMVWVSKGEPTVALAGLSLAVLTTLATTIVMFHMLRPGLPTVDTELVRGVRAADDTSFRKRERRVVDAVATAILPFLIFYSAWGKYGEEFRLYSVTLFNERGLEGYMEPQMLTGGILPLVVALASFGLRAATEYFYQRNESKILGVLVALFEANWVFFAVFSVVDLTGKAKAWFFGREAWSNLQQEISETLQWLGDITALPVEASYLALLGAAATAWGHLKDGLFEPILWLAIAAVVFGAEMTRHESLFRQGTKGSRVERAVYRTPVLMKGFGTYTGVSDKYVPILNALRFVLRVGPVFCLSFCLYYVLVDLGFSWLHRGIFALIGPNEFLGWWWQWLSPIEFAMDALQELMRVCLLAATFEMVLRLVGAAGGSGRRGRRSVRTMV